MQLFYKSRIDEVEKMEKYAIRVKNVSKMYKLYDRNKDRLIDAFGLSKTPRYHEHYALHNLNIDVKTGECVGIIGTNGAGKSTILKIITGVLNPTEGEVEINGRISALLELGAGFNMEYTGIENIYLNGTMIGFSREEIDKKMDDILAFADIGDFVYLPERSHPSAECHTPSAQRPAGWSHTRHTFPPALSHTGQKDITYRRSPPPHYSVVCSSAPNGHPATKAYGYPVFPWAGSLPV